MHPLEMPGSVVGDGTGTAARCGGVPLAGCLVCLRKNQCGPEGHRFKKGDAAGNQRKIGFEQSLQEDLLRKLQD